MAGIISCIGIGWLAYNKSWESIITATVTVLVTGIATIFAAKYGATLAFELSAKKERDEIKNINRADGNIAVFILGRMITELDAYRKDCIEPNRAYEFAFLAIRPTLTIEKLKLNIEGLYFLLETDEANLLGELALTEQWYRITIDAINERSRIHREEAQPRLEKGGFIQGQTPTIKAPPLLGERLCFILKDATDTMIKGVDDTIDRLKLYAEQLAKCLKKNFPEGKTIRIEIPLANKND